MPCRIDIQYLMSSKIPIFATIILFPLNTNLASEFEYFCYMKQLPFCCCINTAASPKNQWMPPRQNNNNDAFFNKS